MPKAPSKTKFVCQQCGGQSARWVGRCPACGEWNSLVETREGPRRAPAASYTAISPPQPIAQIAPQGQRRIPVPLEEFARVLGGGIVPGSLVLVGGDPGIGKSTLLLQVAGLVAQAEGTVLYVSGEESAEQLKMRADRIGLLSERLYILAETNLSAILECIEGLSPRLVVIDSIQAVYCEELESGAGSIGQLRESTLKLMRLAKASGIPIFLVGHVTKEGAIAGPRVIEHIVDAVLYLEGERFHAYRLLRGVKNRFGSTNEVGVFEMRSDGLAEVLNPSQAFLAERSPHASGSVVVVTLEGSRPLLVEVQALTTPTSFGLPRRTANGIELGRLILLTAVLTKRVGLALSNQDIYVNVVGGLKIAEPAADLGVAVAIASAFRDIPVAPDLVAIGEIGLSGELRAVGQAERRLSEAAKLGFQRCLLPKAVLSRRLATLGLKTYGVGTVREALEAALA